MEPATVQSTLQAALGTRYTLEREIGRGGMATVYLADDARHHRRVAVKVLHAELSAALGVERFLREIELTASLQHPHILPLFDSGAAGGLLYYVMPFVEGETLRARLARERLLPVDEAVRITVDVASALDFAHRRGIVHRDLKPENILLQDGLALVADFGIARAVQRAAGADTLTITGLVVGTPAYMSPEQAAGEHTLDGRSDIFALGSVLYEMLAGAPPFAAPTAQGVMARVMAEEPRPLAVARPSVPPQVELAVRRALAKVPADRFASASAFAAALGDRPASTVALWPCSERPRTVRPGMATLAAGALAAALASGWAIGRMSAAGGAPAEVRRLVRFTVELDSAALTETAPAISPDGRTIVYALDRLEGSRLHVRRLDEIESRPLAGTEGAEAPFFSADGAWIAFYSDGALRKIRADGGAPVVVAGLPPSLLFSGGSWGANDTIVFSNTGLLYRVPGGGGTPSRIPTADTSLRLLHPHLLPDGRNALVTLTPDYNVGRVGVLDLASGRVREFGAGLMPRYSAGQLVYGTLAGELHRRPFDLERLQPTGPPERLASGIELGLIVGVAFDVARAGTLVYREGTRFDAGSMKLMLTDRAGRQQRVFPRRGAWAPRFSSDGTRVLHGGFAPGRDSSDLWITELASGRTQRLTTDGNDNNDPLWSPDGRFVAYSAEAAGGKDVFVQALHGGPARPLVRQPGIQWPTDWLRDGSALLFTNLEITAGREGEQDIWVQPTDGTAARPLVATPGREIGGRVSPDGRWVAYQSTETGRWEVYVRSYPTPGRPTLVSTSGGVHPVWQRDGRALYFWQRDSLIVTRLERGAAGAPPTVRGRTALFRAHYADGVLANYDVSPDGTRFVILSGGNQTARLVVVLDAVGAAR